MNEEPLAKFLARRQKRLQYWREAFSQPSMRPEAATELSRSLDYYAQLLARLGTTADEAEQNQLRQRILAADRELTDAFESRRLATNSMNANAVAATPVMKPR